MIVPSLFVMTAPNWVWYTDTNNYIREILVKAITYRSGMLRDRWFQLCHYQNLKHSCDRRAGRIALLVFGNSDSNGEQIMTPFPFVALFVTLA